MEQVKKGEIYWYIIIFGGNELDIEYTYESLSIEDSDRFELGNYFHTKEQAEVMVKKLRAVLKGADVIEMPSEKEIENEAYENNHIHKYRGDCNFPNEICIESFKEGVDWLKSKLIK